jgi:benzylsuccinate CoA-transferase BbsF subunit
MERGLREGVTIAPVNTVADLSRFRQLEERGYWLEALLPNGTKARMPGFPARPSDAPMTVRRWAPRIGEHSEDVLGAAAATDRAPVVHALAKDGADGNRLPFAGLNVADFTWIAAGPTATKYLADHGATVVRVETENPPDMLRAAGPFKDGVPGANRSQFFGEYNTSKLGISLDLKNPAGRDVARRLIEWADVCVNSFTPGTMGDLGIGYEWAKQANPSIIFASSCLMGQTGPAAAFAGYGYHAAAIAGFFEVTGWPDLPPDGPWAAYTDVVSPRFFAATIMAALERRRRTGRGERIDLSQLESGLTFLAPQLIDYQASGRIVTRAGNRSETAAPHAAYPCAGDDQWCAIAVETDEQWRALRSALGDPEWARDERFAEASGRLAAEDEIDARLSDWTRARSPYEVMRLLQEAGVPAGVAQRSSDLLNDPQLAHRGFHHYMEHPEMGNIPYAGHEFRIRGYDSGPRFPAPCLGQHNEQVMREILGMSDDEISEVLVAGAVV